jgi:membrane associated rhomboid family serine protease
MPDADSPVAGGVRLTASIPATLAFCLVLVAVYLLELYVWESVGTAAFVALFVARQEPSVGWLLAPLSHSPFSVWHLVGSTVQVLAFGGLAEYRLPRRDYVAFLVAAGVASTGAQVAVYAAAGPSARGLGVLGASGIALGLAAFVVVDSLRYRDAADRWHGDATVVIALLAVVVLGTALLEAALGAPGIAVTGHLAGIGLGTTYGLARSREAVLAGGGPRRYARRRRRRRP